MHRVEIRFDQVFSIVRKRAPMGGRYTNFGFESNGKKTYDIVVPGWPIIEAGMSVVVFFGKENDWSSLLGWVDSYGHSTVQTNPYLFAFISLASAFFMLLLLSGHFPWFVNVIICAVFGGPAILFLMAFVKQIQIHQEVTSLLESTRRNQLAGK
jgi:hypothetical protein